MTELFVLGIVVSIVLLVHRDVQAIRVAEGGLLPFARRMTERFQRPTDLERRLAPHVQREDTPLPAWLERHRRQPQGGGD